MPWYAIFRIFAWIGSKLFGVAETLGDKAAESRAKPRVDRPPAPRPRPSRSGPSDWAWLPEDRQRPQTNAPQQSFAQRNSAALGMLGIILLPVAAIVLLGVLWLLVAGAVVIGGIGAVIFAIVAAIWLVVRAAEWATAEGRRRLPPR